jgi:hypothetical protein
MTGCGETTKVVVVTQTASSAQRPTAQATTSKTKKAKRKMKSCDVNIRARIGTTSCAFAENVFYSFWNALEAGDDAFTAYSPVTGRSYRVRCSTADTVACRAGDGAYVRFSMRAVRAYSASQADSYACSHQVSEDGVGDCPEDENLAPPPAPDEPSAATEDDCDASYDGACLDPNASDYDCAGGSGDGPEYTGPVQVVGDDHFDLDRDGDGYACEG